MNLVDCTKNSVDKKKWVFEVGEYPREPGSFFLVCHQLHVHIHFCPKKPVMGFSLYKQILYEENS
jgi:hypothetical protein